MIAKVMAGLFLAALCGPASAQEIAGDWIDGERHRVRIIAGSVPGAAAGTITAFIEMSMDRGWKTYWMNPGTAGGIPPEFKFEGSKNLAKAEVLYPVPQVMSDKAGDVIGYREYAVFPIRVTPADPAEPVEINVTANYGICEKLCVPAETALALTVPSGPLAPAGPDAARAYAAVPRPVAERRDGDPFGLTAVVSADAPNVIRLSATFAGAAEAARVFLAVPDGRYLPLAVKHDQQGETVTFDVTFSDARDLAALKGASVTAVLAGEKGQSEDRFVID